MTGLSQMHLVSRFDHCAISEVNSSRSFALQIALRQSYMVFVDALAFFLTRDRPLGLLRLHLHLILSFHILQQRLTTHLQSGSLARVDRVRDIRQSVRALRSTWHRIPTLSRGLMRDSMRSHTQLFAAGRQQSVIRWQPGLTKRRRGLASGERVSESFAMIGRCWVGLRFVHYINKLKIIIQ